ncbi:nucleotide exchange factor GrpE [Bdellovibrio sp. SKB1291214]|uniref:nucleotide exchange factor GrpE n=1 Tax=Bdellovibrio sp. SKB1291214 TaxID=1732569 RepID=UPI000B51CF38|nr:nucleotide exchange factor GrpE [Bdellovibrio sp. SKB1291214]UYL10755.1 nucleotide exchange factor GrpE [Bdellovibrio sp. SKB1291214]
MSEENNSQNSNPAASENFDVSSEIQKLQDQAEKYKNDFLYLRAEFENYKRNAIKERSELMKYGGERFIRDLLDIVDNFDRALAVNVTAENLGTYKQGIEMTASELRNLLAKHSVIEIPSEGAPFDPNIHEALSSEATEKVAPGHVARVFKKPYKLHDKVIRTGQVVVAKKPE